ncbi:MAG: FAD-dependent oxidoreductase, partial [Candidatus Eremiobacteraeota bacterium]|nr:FAD-dependent oxidoreductase [Candidatus Eremiobacteraeota bacterium]
MVKRVTVVGAGLAGSEAAWQIAQAGIPVTLYEMRPRVQTGAHAGGGLAELVCSNSLRAASLENAVGLLKEEMARLGSLIIEAARATAVPAGGALAVDRERFSAYVEDKICAHPLIDLRREEVRAIPNGLSVIACGPLASDALAGALERLCGPRLH